MAKKSELFTANSINTERYNLKSSCYFFINYYNNIFNKPPLGIEPKTFALQVQRSTTKLVGQKNDADEIRTRDPIGKWISSPSP